MALAWTPEPQNREGGGAGGRLTLVRCRWLCCLLCCLQCLALLLVGYACSAGLLCSAAGCFALLLIGYAWSAGLLRSAAGWLCCSLADLPMLLLPFMMPLWLLLSIAAETVAPATMSCNAAGHERKGRIGPNSRTPAPRTAEDGVSTWHGQESHACEPCNQHACKTPAMPTRADKSDTLARQEKLDFEIPARHQTGKEEAPARHPRHPARHPPDAQDTRKTPARHPQDAQDTRKTPARRPRHPQDTRKTPTHKTFARHQQSKDEKHPKDTRETPTTPARHPQDIRKTPTPARHPQDTYARQTKEQGCIKQVHFWYHLPAPYRRIGWHKAGTLLNPPDSPSKTFI